VQRLLLPVLFTFSKVPKLRITPFMLLTGSGKTVLFFEAWTKSKAFRAAHSRAGEYADML
jgi:hypothetical protein